MKLRSYFKCSTLKTGAFIEIEDLEIQSVFLIYLNLVKIQDQN